MSWSFVNRAFVNRGPADRAVHFTYHATVQDTARELGLLEVSGSVAQAIDPNARLLAAHVLCTVPLVAQHCG